MKEEIELEGEKINFHNIKEFGVTRKRSGEVTLNISTEKDGEVSNKSLKTNDPKTKKDLESIFENLCELEAKYPKKEK